jgi:hypothetical protein
MCRKLTCPVFLGLLLAAGLCSVACGELVGWWKLDETSGTTAADSSGKGNNGTLQGAGAWVAGHLGGAWQGTGSDAYIQIPHSDSLNIANAVTVAVWLNLAGSTNYQIVEKGGTDGNAWKFSYGFRTETSRQLRAQWDNVGFYTGTAGVVPLSTWTNVAITFDPAGGPNNWKWYVNGVVTNQTTWAGPLRTNTNAMVLGRDNYGSGRWYFNGMMDDLRIYNEALTADMIALAMTGGGMNVGAATGPVPAAKATDVPRDTVLSWKPGPFPGTHNVYFGTSFADVNAPSVTMLVSQGQDANTYDPPGVLAFGQIYYWRIDEVNASSDHKVFTGDVWSFTVEAASYAIKSVNITTTASGSATNMGPEKTIGGSGLDASDLHGTTDTTMWLSDSVMPAWIQYDFNDVYKLQEMWVWNSNQLIEAFAGLGAKDVVVEYSVDGVTWTTLTGVPPFARAPGAAGYAHNTTVNFAGAVARYVKLTINSNWGGIMPQVGLSEVRFFYTPVQAREPQPTTGKTGVAPDVVLSWRSGREAASHKVYVGTDPNVLTLAGTVTANSFSPTGLSLGTTYYWRVDEVNMAEATSIWTGKVWSFATSPFIGVDDMESYNDTTNPIFNAWVDGYSTSTTNAAVVGLNAPANGTFCSTAIFHAGKQSMPLAYNNSNSVPNAEATRTFDSAQDWTLNGVKTLTLYFYGQAANATNVPLWIKLTDQSGKNAKVTFGSASGEDPIVLTDSAWTTWNVPLSNFSGITLSKIKSMTIGLGSGTGTGTLYIDDVRLYPATTAAPAVTPTLVGWWKLDNDVKDSSGNDNSGTITGAPTYVAAGKIGAALKLNGTTDYVDCGNGASLNITDVVTLSAWIQPTDITMADYHDIVAKGDHAYSIRTGNNGQIQFYFYDGAAYHQTNSPTYTSTFSSAWHHVAASFDGTQSRVYVDGQCVSSSLFTGGIASTTRNVNLGHNAEQTARLFNGQIDDVRIYRGALPTSEIAKLANP